MEPKCTREGCGGLRVKHDIEAPHGYIDTGCEGYLAERPCDTLHGAEGVDISA